jgi:hypothetical protein
VGSHSASAPTSFIHPKNCRIRVPISGPLSSTAVGPQALRLEISDKAQMKA